MNKNYYFSYWKFKGKKTMVWELVTDLNFLKDYAIKHKEEIKDMKEYQNDKFLIEDLTGKLIAEY